MMFVSNAGIVTNAARHTESRRLASSTSSSLACAARARFIGAMAGTAQDKLQILLVVNDVWNGRRRDAKQVGATRRRNSGHVTHAVMH